MKKITALILLFAVFSALLSACSAKEEEKEIGIWEKGGITRPYNYSLSKYVVLGEYIGLETEKITFTYDKNARLSADLIKLYPDLVSYEDADKIRKGEAVTASCRAIKDGVPCEDFSFDSLSVVIGGAAKIPGIEDDYIARAMGLTVENALAKASTDSENTTVAEYTFPEYYENTDYAGKTLELELTVKKVQSVKLDGITDETVSAGGTYPTLEALKTAISKKYDTDDAEIIQSAYEKILWKRVVDGAQLMSALPAAEYERCREEYINYYKELASYNGCSFDEYIKIANLDESDILSEAEKYAQTKVKNEIVAFAIAQDDELTLTQTEFQSLAFNAARKFGYSGYTDFIAYNGEKNVYVYTTWKKVAEYIVSKAEVK